MLPGSVELLPEHVHGMGRSLDRHHVAKVAGDHEMGPVVHGVVRRELDDAAGTILDEIGEVIAHERGVIVQAVLDEIVQGLGREPVGRGAVAARRLAGCLDDGLEAPFEPVELVRGIKFVGCSWR
jgi:hypothetical protein